MLLGGIFGFTRTIITIGYDILAGYLRHAIGQRMQAVNELSAVMFGGLALRLLVN